MRRRNLFKLALGAVAASAMEVFAFQEPICKVVGFDPGFGESIQVNFWMRRNEDGSFTYARCSKSPELYTEEELRDLLVSEGEMNAHFDKFPTGELFVRESPSANKTWNDVAP